MSAQEARWIVPPSARDLVQVTSTTEIEDDLSRGHCYSRTAHYDNQLSKRLAKSQYTDNTTDHKCIQQTNQRDGDDKVHASVRG